MTKRYYTAIATANTQEGKYTRTEQLPSLAFDAPSKSEARKRAVKAYKAMLPGKRCTVRSMGPRYRDFPKGKCVIFLDVEEA